MKVLFLDIDGVLNSRQSVEMQRRIESNRRLPTYIGEDCFCPVAISNLNCLMEEVTNLRIVISSTWRIFHTLDCIRYGLNLAGFLYAHKIYGVTPHNRMSCRGKEIEAWLDVHGDPLEVGSFAILDDSSDMGEYSGHLVKTNYSIGFSMIELDEVVQGFSSGRFKRSREAMNEC